MFIRFALTALSTAFLAAAALAVVPSQSQTAMIIPLNPSVNTTVIEKNSAWPVKQNISLDPCAKVSCVNA